MQEEFMKLHRALFHRGKIYTNGRYWVGLARNFIKYPSNQQNVLFSNDADADAPAIAIRVSGEGDSGGGTLRIDISFQYLMVPAELDALFRDVEQNYQSRISDEARDILAATAQRFELNDYFIKRPAVRAAFLEEITAPLRILHVVPVDLQVRRIVLSANVEQSILNKAVSRQQVLRSEQTNQRLDLEAQQNVVRGSGTEAIRSRNAQFAARAAILVQSAQANATAINVGASAFAASRLQNGTGFDTQELLYYRWLQDVVRTAPAQSSITSQMNPTAVL
jgi:hypothetical protein